MSRTTTTAPATESAVRDYLLYLRDPAPFRDESDVLAIRQEIAGLVEQASSWDPIEYLSRRAALDARLRSALDAQDPSERIRSAFVEAAPRYSADRGVTVELWKEVGGPKIVPALREAGLMSGKPAKRLAPSARRRAPRLTDAEVVELLPTEPFTVNSLAVTLGRRDGTVRNYVARLVAAGLIVEVGPDKSSKTPRRPMVYRRRRASRK